MMIQALSRRKDTEEIMWDSGGHFKSTSRSRFRASNVIIACIADGSSKVPCRLPPSSTVPSQGSLVAQSQVGIPWPGAQTCAIYRPGLYLVVGDGQLVAVVAADSSFVMSHKVKQAGIKVREGSR